MADFYSDQMTNLNASPINLMDSNEGGAPSRRNWFSYTVPTGGVVAGKTLSLTKIPAGSRITGGVIITDGLVAAGIMDVGTSASAAQYANDIAVATAGAVLIANTIALNVGDVLTADTEIIATNPAGAATWTAAKLIKGYIEYSKI